MLDPSMPEGVYLDGANTTQREALGLPLLAFNPDGEPVDIVNHEVNFGWEYVYHCHILSHEEMDMMHAQVVGVAPAAPTDIAAVASGNGNNRRYTVTWMDNSKNETAFVILRSSSPTGPWSILATVPSDPLIVGPGTGPRTYEDRTRDTWYYQVYAINVVGDAVGPVFFHGQGAGQMPTASAVVADMIDVAVGRAAITFVNLKLWSQQPPRVDLSDHAHTQSKYYFRFDVLDQPGVLAQIAGILGKHHISIASVHQYDRDKDHATGTVPLVIVTHRAQEQHTSQAQREIQQLQVVKTTGERLRILSVEGGT
jgi:hypothetical protein